MKKIIVTALVGLMAYGAMFARGNFDKIFKEFKDADGVQYVEVPKSMIEVAGGAGRLNGVPVAENLSGLRVLVMENCDRKFLDGFCNKVNAAAKGLDVAVKTNENDESVTVWVAQDDEAISEFYVLSVENNECNFVEITGNFDQELIAKMFSGSK